MGFSFGDGPIPFWGWFVPVVCFWGLCPACGVRQAGQLIDDLVAQVVPFAIGMADSIDDSDAINYAANLYASIADGQSIRSSHLRAQSVLELAGLEGADLPVLAWSGQADPANTVLVRPPSPE
jgi:hypothetical protein